MSNQSKDRPSKGELVAFEPRPDPIVLPPDSGYVGEFLAEVLNMFKARAMRMTSQLARINESGQRTEALLRMAAERMEAAEARLEQDLGKQGLLSDTSSNDESEE
jgi:hypothetical protein